MHTFESKLHRFLSAGHLNSFYCEENRHQTVIFLIILNVTDKATMKVKQSILNNFYKRTGGGSSDEGENSDNESVYLPSKSKRMYETPMSWTRVKEVQLAAI